MSEKNMKMDHNDAFIENPMGYAPIFPLIIKMSLPAISAMLISALYNTIDSIYVARLSQSALSAVSLVYPIQMLNIAVCVGTGVGLASLISRRLGEKNVEAADSAVNHGLIIANLEYLIFLLFGLFGSAAFAGAFTTDTEIFSQAVTYCRIVSIGSIFIFNALTGERSMQACGNMLLPMISQMTGSIINIILDPILIFGYFGMPAMGVAGAAYATIIGQCGSMILAHIFLRFGKFPVKINFKGFKFQPQIVKDIYEVALPAMVMQSITSLTIMVLNKILIAFSATAVAVLGAYFKVQSFVFMPVIGLNNGIMPLMGYNFGARNKKRLLDSLKISIVLAFGIMVLGFALFQIFPSTIMSLFNPDEEMMQLGIKALRTISWCFPFAALSIIPAALFQATAHGTYSMLVSIFRQVVFIMPSAYILSKFIGTDGVWLSYVIAEGGGMLATAFLFSRLYKNKLKDL